MITAAAESPGLAGRMIMMICHMVMPAVTPPRSGPRQLTIAMLRGLFLLGFFTISETHFSTNVYVSDFPECTRLSKKPAFAAFDASIHNIHLSYRGHTTIDFACYIRKRHTSDLQSGRNHKLPCLCSTSLNGRPSRWRHRVSFVFSCFGVQHSTRTFMAKGDFGPADAFPFDPRPNGRSSKKWGRPPSGPRNQENTR